MLDVSALAPSTRTKRNTTHGPVDSFGRIGNDSTMASPPTDSAPTVTSEGSRWQRFHLVALFVLLLGGAVSTALFVEAREHAHEQRRLAFERQAQQVAATLHTSFDLPLEIVRGIPAFFDASERVSQAQFAAFAQRVLRRHPSVYALEWIPRVSHESRSEVERRAREEGRGGFVIREVGSDGDMVPAKHRDTYLPILYMYPENDIALGFDVASDAERRAPADRARDLGQAVASPRIRLVEDPPEVYSVAIFVPVYAGGGIPEEPFARRNRLRGFGAEVFRIEPVVSRALEHVDLSGLDLVLEDENAPRNISLLYESRPGLSADPPADRLHWSQPMPYAHRNWTLHFYEAPGAPPGASPWHVLIRGILISLLASLMIFAGGTILGLRRQVRAARQLGQYTLDTRLGHGAMGVVYRARHAMLRRPTAIKLMTGKETHHLVRFEREVQMTSRLTHPNTIAIYDYGRTPHGVFYYAMELLEGMTLETLVEVDGPQPPARVLHILRQVCGAIAEAHSVGLIHRDIKPANVMLTRRGGIPDFVKVLDFGLVKDLQDADAKSLSTEGSLVGTPLYLAPEAITQPSTVGEPADLYAIGAVGYFLLAGAPVFEGNSLVEVCGQHLHTAPVPPSLRIHRDIPDVVEAIVLQCLAKDPEDRPESAEDLARDIEEAQRQGLEWTTEQARAWWNERADEVLRRARQARDRRSASSAGKQTMAVDVSHRDDSSRPAGEGRLKSGLDG